MIHISDYDPFDYRMVGEIPIYVGDHKLSLCLGVEIIVALIEHYRTIELPLDSQGLNTRFIETNRFEGHSMSRLTLYLECYEYVHSMKGVFLDKIAQQCIHVVCEHINELDIEDTKLISIIEKNDLLYDIIIHAFNSGAIDTEWIISNINEHLISLDKKSPSAV